MKTTTRRPRSGGFGAAPSRARSFGVAGRISIALLLGVGLLLPGQALGDGGTIRLSGLEFGDYRVTVFTDPTPVRPDSIDVSFLITEADGLSVAQGLEIWVDVEPLDHAGRSARHPATREQADDPRMYAAKFALGSPGRWRVAISVRGDGGSGEASFEISASEGNIFDRPGILLVTALMPLILVGLWLHFGNRPHSLEE